MSVCIYWEIIAIVNLRLGNHIAKVTVGNPQSQLKVQSDLQLSPFFSLYLSHTSLHSALVNYHMLNSVQCSEAIMAGSVYETAEGSTIEIGCDGDSLTVNGIKMVLKKDIVTTNGVIHLIDRVLVPDSGKTHLEF